MINQLAAAALPEDVPEFLRSKSAQEAMAYYAPHPDDWRNEEPREALYATLVPEHDLDIEWADLAGPLPRYRYEYIAALEAAQAAHPEVKLTPQAVGLLPYSSFEHYEMLKSAMRDYRRALAAKQDTKAAEAEIVVLAGFLGHFVGDGSQPLHMTYRYNGWVGPNPNGYTTDNKIHARFEGDYVHYNIKAADVAPLVAGTKPQVLGDVFEEYVKYLRHTNSLAEKVYQLDKEGGFTDAGTPESKAFTEQQLAAGAIELRNMIYTAWVKSGEPMPSYRGN
jgi:hypothetical protein